MAEHGMKDRRWHKRTKGVSHKLPEGYVIKPHPAFNRNRVRGGHGKKPVGGVTVDEATKLVMAPAGAEPENIPTVVVDKPLPEGGKKTTKKKKETNK